MNLKKPCTISEQIQKLKDHGVVIKDEDAAYSFLSQVNYYRLTGYLLQYRINPENSDYAVPVDFCELVELYKFDSELRNLYRKYLEIIELFYRTKISYTFSLLKCKNEPYDQHYSEDSFYNKEAFKNIKNGFENEEEGYYCDSLIVKHHKNKYGNQMPLWVLVELLSFSKLSKLYRCMYDSDQDKISASVGTGRKTLGNHLHCLTILRNKCAHCARLYNSSFSLPAQMPKKFLRDNPAFSNTSLFSYTLVLVKRLPDTETRSSFVKELTAVFDKFSDYIDLSLIGFPKLYSDILNVYV